MLIAIALAAAAVLASLVHAAAILPRSPREIELKQALLKRQSVTARPATDEDILNFALSLEFIEIALYTGALSNFTQADFLAAGLPKDTRAEVEQLKSDEQAHAEFIKSAIEEANGTAVQPCRYQFPCTDVHSFIALARIIEGVGTSAYLGALAAIRNPEYVTGSGAILTVEARHNSLLRLLNGENPNPAPFDTPLSGQAVTSLADGFFVPGSCANGSDSSLAFKPFPALTVANADNLVIGSTIQVTPDKSSAACNTTSSGPNSTVFCAFASGLTVGFSPWSNGSCTIPLRDVTPGTTYLALTSVRSIDDASILAGMAVLNILGSTSNPSGSTPAQNITSIAGNATLSTIVTTHPATSTFETPTATLLPPTPTMSQ